MRLAVVSDLGNGVSLVRGLHDAEDPNRIGVKPEVANKLLELYGPGVLAWTVGAREDDEVVQSRDDGTVLVPRPPAPVLKVASLREAGDRVASLEDELAALKERIAKLEGLHGLDRGPEAK